MTYRLAPPIKTFLLLGAGIILGTAFGASISEFHNNRPQYSGDLINLNGLGKYKFTNELLTCGDIDSMTVGAVEALKTSIEADLNQRLERREISHASVYMRDLDNGPWFGLNEKEFFYPASLLKVPLIFATYKIEERDPGFLDKSVLYDEVLIHASYLFPPRERLVIGESYPIRELLRRAIVYSDNEAAALLGGEIGFAALQEVFFDFGVTRPKIGEDYQMRVRSYSSFFRVLYNASYISRDHSEEGLTLLSQSEFNQGVVSGVPKGVEVAHKFGEREGALANGDVQLHDCGIVYAHARPYLLCIMAQAKTAGAILDFMKEVSLKTYQTMSKE